MIQEEQQLFREVKNLFNNYKLKECIQYVDKHDQNVSFECHQSLQLYKGFTLLEQSLIQDGCKCFDKIIEEAQQKKGESINEIDAVIAIIYQLELYFVDIIKAENKNERYLKICEEYQRQNEYLESYKKGIYLFGKGLYLSVKYSKNEQNFDFVPYLEEALELVQEYKQEIMIVLAWCYYEKSKVEQSLKWIQMLYDLNPNYPGVANNLAMVEEKNGNIEKAEQLYKQLEVICENNPIVLSNIAQFYKEQDKQEEEKEYYEKMIKFNQNCPIACSFYGGYLYRTGQQEESIKMLQNAIELDPNSIRPYEEFIAIYSNSYDYENAVENIKKCIEINPNDSIYYTILGEYYEEYFQNIEEALKAYNKSIELSVSPAYKVFPMSRIASINYSQTNYIESLELFLKVCNLDYDSIIDNEIETVCHIISSIEEIPISVKTDLIFQQEGPIVMKFERFAQQVLQHKLDILRAILQFLSYSKNIQSELTFQSLVSHFDLFID